MHVSRKMPRILVFPGIRTQVPLISIALNWLRPWPEGGQPRLHGKIIRCWKSCRLHFDMRGWHDYKFKHMAIV